MAHKHMTRSALLRSIAKGPVKKDDRPFTIYLGHNMATYDDDGSPVPEEIAKDPMGRRNVHLDLDGFRFLMNTGYAEYGADYERFEKEQKPLRKEHYAKTMAEYVQAGGKDYRK